MNKKIEIYVSCHKESYVPNNSLLIPIQVGTALSNKKLEGMLYDNVGDNISEKNKYYCELTAQYWAWKNTNADYYGFFHYRRYLSFEEEYLIDANTENGLPKPYVTYESISDDVMEKICLDEAKMRELIEQYDILVPIKEKNNCSVYEQYKVASFHNIEDFDIILDIVKEKYPEFTDAMNTYLNSNKNYYCNMYIMKREIFEKYCSWLFDILLEHEKRGDFEQYSVDEYRVSGFLAERLFGIYFTYIKGLGKFKCGELQRAEFRNTEPKVIMKPVFNENCVPIVLAANDEFSPYLATMIQSIIDNSNSNNYYDIIILHKDIDEYNKNSIIKMSSEFKNISIRFYNTSALIDDRNFFVDKHLSVETYFRLLIQDILLDYEKILYLDCDMVVEDDVALLFNSDIEGCLLGAVKDIDYAGVYKESNERRNYTQNILKLNNPFNYFQAGVLVMNLKEFRKRFTVKELLDVATSYKWKHHDQDVLNHLCEGHVKFIDMSWNVVIDWKNNFSSRMDIAKCAPRNMYYEYLESRKNPKIVHYAGYQKPWNEPRCDFSDEFWKYARRTHFYEEILRKMISNSDNLRIRKLKPGEKAIKIKGTGKSIIIDMKKINNLFPPGSRKRIFVKNLAKLIYK